MEYTGLKEEVIERINKDPKLFADVAFTLMITPVSLIRVLSQNNKKLMHPNVLTVIRKGLGLQDNTQLLEMQVPQEEISSSPNS